MNRRILRLALPSILANVTVPLVGMADLAVSGRLGQVAAIGAVAVGTLLFDMLYWNMGFLRIGTGGLTAQAYGRRDLPAAVTCLTQGLATALAVALLVWVMQGVYAAVAFRLIDASSEVAALARRYFFIRIWAAPATLSLYVFKGWFIGMQNTVSPMAVDVTVNVVNLAVSWLLALHTSLGFAGIAWGTVAAQYTGLVLAVLLLRRYYRRLFRYADLRRDIRLRGMRRFFVLNGNLLLRSVCMLLVYAGFTSLAARYGDRELAVGSIMMKLLLLYSYFLDGFAYAGEALAGRYIGARNRSGLVRAVRCLFGWSLAVGAVSTLAYYWGGETMFGWISPDPDLCAAAEPYLVWLLWMPLLGSAAFMWDGIFIGATAGRAIRDSMLWSVAAFFGVYSAMHSWAGPQALYWAYSAHLAARAVCLSLLARREVFGKPFARRE